MMQKVIQVGNSIAVVIPRVLNDGSVGRGDTVKSEKKDGKFIFSPVKKRKKLAGGVDGKFAKIVDEFASDHKDVLEELVNR